MDAKNTVDFRNTGELPIYKVEPVDHPTTDIEQRLREAMDGVTAELHRLLEASHRRQPDIDAITEKYGSDWHLRHVPQIKCADGFKMSVQASAFNYCAPRDSYGPWASVEVGYPSERVEAFMPYIDDGEETDATATVYGYVPIEIVAKAIVDHGGFEQAASLRSKLGEAEGALPPVKPLDLAAVIRDSFLAGAGMDTSKREAQPIPDDVYERLNKYDPEHVPAYHRLDALLSAAHRARRTLASLREADQ